jgi:hypothetical protein
MHEISAGLDHPRVHFFNGVARDCPTCLLPISGKNRNRNRNRSVSEAFDELSCRDELQFRKSSELILTSELNRRPREVQPFLPKVIPIEENISKPNIFIASKECVVNESRMLKPSSIFKRHGERASDLSRSSSQAVGLRTVVRRQIKQSIGRRKKANVLLYS